MKSTAEINEALAIVQSIGNKTWEETLTWAIGKTETKIKATVEFLKVVGGEGTRIKALNWVLE